MARQDEGARVNWLREYHDKIQTGEIVAGYWVKNLYEWLLDAIAREQFFYSPKKADRAITFIENYCHHSEGGTGLLILELWQRAMIAAIFGIVDTDGLRVFREVFVVVGRKNGKTLLASAIIAYMAFLDGEYGAKIYCIGPKLEQAEKAFDGFYQIVRAEPELADLVRTPQGKLKRRSDIYYEEMNTSIKPLAFSAKKSDGFNPHLVVGDEIASWEGDRGLKQYEVMKSALGSRAQPMILSITTAGYVNDSVYDELYRRATAVLRRTSKETRLLPFLYIIDDEAKWDDLTELKKANPNMGVSVSRGFYEDEIIIARENTSKRMEFKTKYCNLKQHSTAAWLEYSTVNAACADFSLGDFAGCYAVGGIDLSQTTDLTAACVLIERAGVIYGFAQFFMPANRLETLTAIDHVPYDIYREEGLLTLSGENYVDYKDVYRWFVDLRENHKIFCLQIGYDRYSAQYLIDDLNLYGYHTDDVFQGENLTPVTKEFDGIIRDGNFKICKNNLLKSHFLNVALKENTETRKTRPVKIEQNSRIDGFVAVIDAMTVRQKYYGELMYMLKNEG